MGTKTPPWCSAPSNSSLTHVIEAHKNGNRDLALPSGEVFRAIFYPGRPAVTHSEIESALTEKTNQEETRQRFRAYRALTSVRDALGIFAYPQPGLAVVLWVPFDRDLALSRFEHHVLHRVSGHLDSAFRLRYHPDLAVAAVLSPDGRFLDLDDSSIEGAQRERLAGRVIALERTRLRDRRKDPNALDDWGDRAPA
jgi:hypothetical protein